jgi:hypothetical protein
VGDDAGRRSHIASDDSDDSDDQRRRVRRRLPPRSFDSRGGRVSRGATDGSIPTFGAEDAPRLAAGEGRVSSRDVLLRRIPADRALPHLSSPLLVIMAVLALALTIVCVGHYVCVCGSCGTVHVVARGQAVREPGAHAAARRLGQRLRRGSTHWRLHVAVDPEEPRRADAVPAWEWLERRLRSQFRHEPGSSSCGRCRRRGCWCHDAPPRLERCDGDADDPTARYTGLQRRVAARLPVIRTPVYGPVPPVPAVQSRRRRYVHCSVSAAALTRWLMPPSS